MKLFLTGGSGFLGKTLIKYLLRENYQVYALARSKKASRLVSDRGAIAVRGDLDDPDSYLRALKGQPPLTKSIVYLMGTEFSIDDSKARNQLEYRNVISIEEGLKALRQAN